MKNFSLYLNLKTRIVEFSFGTKKIFFYLTLQGVNPSYTPSRLVLLFCFRFVDIVPRVSARLSIITNQKTHFRVPEKLSYMKNYYSLPIRMHFSTFDLSVRRDRLSPSSSVPWRSRNTEIAFAHLKQHHISSIDPREQQYLNRWVQR